MHDPGPMDGVQAEQEVRGEPDQFPDPDPLALEPEFRGQDAPTFRSARSPDPLSGRGYIRTVQARWIRPPRISYIQIAWARWPGGASHRS